MSEKEEGRGKEGGRKRRREEESEGRRKEGEVKEGVSE